MKVLFLKDVGGVGKRGEVKEITDGYALNALIPSGKAVQATAAVIAAHEKRTAQNKIEEERHVAAKKAKLHSLEGKSIVVKVRANEKGHLFKGINAKEILAAIKKETGEEFGDHSLASNTLPLRGVGKHALHIETAGAKASFTIVIEAA